MRPFVVSVVMVFLFWLIKTFSLSAKIITYKTRSLLTTELIINLTTLID